MPESFVKIEHKDYENIVLLGDGNGSDCIQIGDRSFVLNPVSESTSKDLSSSSPFFEESNIPFIAPIKEIFIKEEDSRKFEENKMGKQCLHDSFEAKTRNIFSKGFQSHASRGWTGKSSLDDSSRADTESMFWKEEIHNENIFSLPIMQAYVKEEPSKQHVIVTEQKNKNVTEEISILSSHCSYDEPHLWAGMNPLDYSSTTKTGSGPWKPKIQEDDVFSISITNEEPNEGNEKLTEQLNKNVIEETSVISQHKISNSSCEALNYHFITTPSGEKQFKCSHCVYETIRKSDVKRHIKIHSKNTFKCTHCSYVGDQRNLLVKHMKVHNIEKPYKCSQCTYGTFKRYDLKRHMRIHTGEKPFKCTLCRYSATFKGDLKRHLRLHSGEKPFKCSLCSYSAPFKSGVDNHMKTHTRERRYRCEHCSFSVSWKSDLVRHMRIHTGEKPYECPKCPFRAVQKSFITRHMVTHSKRRTFKCLYCSYIGSSRGEVKMHQETHTG